MASGATSGNAGPGVAAPDGYEADTSSMGARSRTINNEAEDAKGEVDDMKTEVKAEDFGKAHGDFQGEYSESFGLIIEGAVAMCTTIGSFAQQIGGAGAEYSSSDASNTGTVNQSGAGM
jgi:hypothetical protein